MKPLGSLPVDRRDPPGAVAPSAPPDLGQIAGHAYQLLHIHELLLKDRPRNLAFHGALKAAVTPGCTVLDIGSGSGIWAVTAALLGAAKVVAIEREPLLIGLIESLARDQGVSDRVQVVCGDSRSVTLQREFDVVVSETIGHVVFDEEIVPIMLDARARFLKPGGAMIPETVSLLAAGGQMERPTLPCGLTGDFSRFEGLMLHSPLALTDKSPFKPLTTPAELITLDLKTLAAEPNLGQLSAQWRDHASAGINSFLVWAEASLGNGVRLSTLDTPSWSATVYRTQPFEATQGDLGFELSLSHQTNQWTVTLDSGTTRESHRHSPAIAAAELLALNTPHPDVFQQMRLATSGLATLPLPD